MRIIPRRLEPVVTEDLRSKMVLIAGPRQCGKTTLAKRLLERLGGAYFDWDVRPHRLALQRYELPEDAPFWVFDELHKYRRWRSWLKGVYDLHGDRHAMLVTGSARLDAYRRGGDSLQGRYLMHHLHPLTLSELAGTPLPTSIDDIPKLPHRSEAVHREGLEALLRFGGFPEPLLSGSPRRAARWRLGYDTRLVRQDLRDLRDLRDLATVEQLHDRLPDTVGSLLSLNALREDLEVAFETVRSWVRALEQLYAVFRVAPYGPPPIRAVKKSRKLYLWDWARVQDAGPRAENLVMLHLLRLVHWLRDVHGEPAELRFFRDTAGHEVDAIVLRHGKPWLAVEVKLSDRPLDRGLRYLVQRVDIPWAFQVSLHGQADRWLPDVGLNGVRMVPAERLLANLP